MNKHGVDQETLIKQFSQASRQQSEALRGSVEQATLRALQGRELTMKSVKQVLQAVMQAVSAGAARNTAAGDAEALLDQAVAGIDAALVRAVQASQRVLQQMVDQGVDVHEAKVKKALADIERMEDAIFQVARKVGASETASIPWGQALGGLRESGSATGASAAAAIEQITARARQAARDGRALGQRAALAMMEHHAAMAGGVLLGMAQALGPVPQASRKA